MYNENNEADKTRIDNVLLASPECSDRPAVTAGVMDREATGSRKWSPDCAHFVCDVDRAIARTLGKEPLLRRAWTRMVFGIDIQLQTEWALVQRMAGVFRERRLHPQDYFRRTGR